MMHEQMVTRSRAKQPDTSQTLRSRRPPAVRDVLASPGRPLDPATCARFASRFGHDFSRVRVHTDARAAQSARALSARAYTVGHHIVFGAGSYQPGSAEGDRLIAHELTHALQQGDVGDLSTRTLMVDKPGNPFDAEASAIADRIMRADRLPDAGRTSAAHVSAEPVVATKLPRAPNAVVVQRALAGGLLGGGVGAVAGGLLGFLIGGPVGAVVGGLIGAAVGAAIGAGGGLFPSYSEIVADADVRARTDAAWASTLAATTATTRREEGFWIRLNKGTGRYEFTPTIIGPVVGPAVGGSVVLGARPADVAPGTDSAIYTVGSFHTHTPTAQRPVGRAVGPSGADHTADTSDDVVGVVYDYVESPVGSGNIPAGHPLASPAQRYHSGPDRRQRV